MFFTNKFHIFTDTHTYLQNRTSNKVPLTPCTMTHNTV